MSRIPAGLFAISAIWLAGLRDEKSTGLSAVERPLENSNVVLLEVEHVGRQVGESISNRVFGGGLWATLANSSSAQEAAAPQSPESTGQGEVERTEESQRPTQLIRIALPIDHEVGRAVATALQRSIDMAPATARPEERPLILLKFDTDRGATGAGSSLAACLELSRLMTRPEANRVETVAWIPAVQDRLRDLAQPGPACRLTDHAVMVAIAAEEIVLAAGGELGPVVEGPARPDPMMLDIYRNLAESRLTLPTRLVLSMVDSNQSLYAVTTSKGELLVDRDELNRLEQAGEAIQSETLSGPGQTARFTSIQLDRFSTNAHVATDLDQLAVRYGINPSDLQFDSEQQRRWKAVQYVLPEYVDRRSVDFGLRAIEDALAKDPEINLVILVNGARGGEMDACLRMATYLSDFDPDKIRTAVFIPQAAQGASGLIALAADHLLLPEKGRLGGAYKPQVAEDELRQVRLDLERIAAAAGRDVALFAACLDPTLVIGRWRHVLTGQVRLMTEEERTGREDADQWNLLNQLDSSEGWTGRELEQDGVARSVLATEGELQAFYQLDSAPRPLTPTKVDQMLERLAKFLSSPFVAAWLLFGAMFLLSTEMSTPGVGIPGLLGTLCLVLFFWSQYLGGNADWLEILLFVVGVVFILMELFLFPGTMVLGIGGLLMVVVSIVLATQTFLIPRNSRELAQLPVSLGLVCAAFSGVFVALLLLRRFLPNAPYFKRLMLEPPAPPMPFEDEPSAGEEFQVRVGQRGVAVSRLVPSGKARFGDKYVDVMTDGIIVDPRTAVEIIEVIGNRVVVRPLDS